MDSDAKHLERQGAVNICTGIRFESRLRIPAKQIAMLILIDCAQDSALRSAALLCHKSRCDPRASIYRTGRVER